MPIVTRSGKGSALTHAEMDGNLTYLVPPGAVMAFARNSAPDGWVECNGSAISRTVYADLFAAIGTTFGAGNGSSTFNVPNLRGEFIRGWDNGRGVDPGRAFGSAQVHATQSHRHAKGNDGSDGGGYNASGRVDSSGYTIANGNQTGEGGFNNTTTSDMLPLTAGGTAVPGGSETRPRNIAMLYCIKV